MNILYESRDLWDIIANEIVELENAAPHNANKLKKKTC